MPIGQRLVADAIEYGEETTLIRRPKHNRKCFIKWIKLTASNTVHTAMATASIRLQQYYFAAAQCKCTQRNNKLRMWCRVARNAISVSVCVCVVWIIAIKIEWINSNGTLLAHCHLYIIFIFIFTSALNSVQFLDNSLDSNPMHAYRIMSFLISHIFDDTRNTNMLLMIKYGMRNKRSIRMRSACDTYAFRKPPRTYCMGMHSMENN